MPKIISLIYLVNICCILNGQEHSEEFHGLKSTCVQHEIDHLNGKLFIDYLGPIKRQMITRKMQKFKREKLRGSE